MRRGAAVSLIAQTGHSDDSHSPDEWARTVVSRIHPASLSIEVVCTVAISCAAERFADDIEPRGERGVAEGLIAFARVGGANGGRERLFRVGEFGLRLGERGRDRPDRFTGPLHGSSPHREDRS